MGIVHVEMETSASAVHSWKKHHMLHLKSARSTLLSNCTMISSLHDYLNNPITYYATSLLLGQAVLTIFQHLFFIACLDKQNCHLFADKSTVKWDFRFYEYIVLIRPRKRS